MSETPETDKLRAWFEREKENGLVSIHPFYDIQNGSTTEDVCCEINEILAAPTVECDEEFF